MSPPPGSSASPAETFATPAETFATPAETIATPPQIVPSESIPPEPVSFDELVEMAPRLEDFAILDGKQIEVADGLSVAMRTNVNEFNSTSDLCLIIREADVETGRLCADRGDLSGLIFMIIPETSSDRQIALALVDSAVVIQSMADKAPRHAALGGFSAYWVDISSLPPEDGGTRNFSMKVSGPGLNVEMLSAIPVPVLDR